MKVISNYKTTLSASMTSSQNTVPVTDITTTDGHTIIAADFDSVAYLVIEPGSANMEIVKVTGVTGSSFTGAIRGLSFYGATETAVPANQKAHQSGSTVIMTNAHYYYDKLMDLDSNETVTGIKTFSVSPIVPTPSTATQAANKSYVDGVAIAGAPNASTTQKGIVEIAMGSELAAGTATGSTGAVIVPGGSSFKNTSSGAGSANTIPVLNDSGTLDKSFVELATDPGLEFSTNGLRAKVKTSGGIIRDANGLSADTTIVQSVATLPAYESIVAGNLLKIINDSGTYKLKKIVGIEGTAVTGDVLNNPNNGNISFDFIATDKIAIAFSTSTNTLRVIVGTISGATIIFGSSVTVSTYFDVGGGDQGFVLKKSATDSFVVVYGYTNGSNLCTCSATAGTVSTRTITLGSEVQLLTQVSAYRPTVDMCEINTGKFAVMYTISSGGIMTYTIVISVSGNAISKGSASGSLSTVNLTPPAVCKIATDKYITYGTSGTQISYIINSVSGVAITPGNLRYITLSSSWLKALYFSDNNLILGYLSSSTTMTLRFYTLSGDTLVLTGSGASFTGFTANTKMPQMNFIMHGNFLYIQDTVAKLAYKFSLGSTTGDFNLVKSVTLTGLGPAYGNIFALNGNTLFACMGTSSSILSFTNYLLDHDEFITSANTSYSYAALIPYNENVFTGFSSLLSGQDYYITSTGQTPTVSSTYQKIGKAINETTILKN